MPTPFIYSGGLYSLFSIQIYNGLSHISKLSLGLPTWSLAVRYFGDINLDWSLQINQPILFRICAYLSCDACSLESSKFDSGLLGYDTLNTAKLPPKFRKQEGSMLLRNVDKYLPINRTSRRLQSSSSSSRTTV